MTGLDADLFATVGALIAFACILRWLWHRDHSRVEPVAEPQSDVEIIWECAAEREDA